MSKYTKDQIDQIRMADPTLSNAELASQTGMPTEMVSYYRRKFNNDAPKPGGNRKTKTPKLKAELEEAPEAFEITVTLTLEQLDKWWQRLGYAQKASVVATNFDLGLGEEEASNG